jgi:membrane-bound ClpP family serine protease
MLGRTAIVKELLNPEGTVLFEGELWTAKSISGNIQPEEEVIIIKVDKLLLTVRKKESKST